MQHYHTSTIVSRKLDASLRYLQLQIRTNCNPLLLSYDEWSFLVTLSWVKMLWHTEEMMQVEIQMKYNDIPLPRQQDCLLIDIFDSANPLEEAMVSFC